jgi:hypothetical protein
MVHNFPQIYQTWVFRAPFDVFHEIHGSSCSMVDLHGCRSFWLGKEELKLFFMDLDLFALSQTGPKGQLERCLKMSSSFSSHLCILRG